MAKLSIIIPVYNVEKYIYECIDSVINQTLRDIEIILVDDASPDNCGIICDEYAAKDNRIKVIHKENGGLCSARNAGIEIATSDFICFLDSDDYARPFAYEELHNVIIENDADMVICHYDRFKDGNNVRSGESIREGNISILSQKNSILKLINNHSINAVFVVVWNRIYKRSIFEKVKFPLGCLVEDEMIAPDIYLECNKIVLYEKSLFCYRETPNSISKQVSLTFSYYNCTAFAHRLKLFVKIGDKDYIEKTAQIYVGYFFVHYYNVLKGEINLKVDKMESIRTDLLLRMKTDFKELLPILLHNSNSTLAKKICYLLFTINDYLFIAFNRVFKIIAL